MIVCHQILSNWTYRTWNWGLNEESLRDTWRLTEAGLDEAWIKIRIYILGEQRLGDKYLMVPINISEFWNSSTMPCKCLEPSQTSDLRKNDPNWMRSNWLNIELNWVQDLSQFNHVIPQCKCLHFEFESWQNGGSAEWGEWRSSRISQCRWKFEADVISCRIKVVPMAFILKYDWIRSLRPRTCWGSKWPFWHSTYLWSAAYEIFACNGILGSSEFIAESSFLHVPR